MKRIASFIIISVLTLCLSLTASAQDELAATLEVLSGGVQVQRVNTGNPIPISVEAIVGVGDLIITDETGSARITFFADGVETIIQPNSQLRIETFEGQPDAFNLTVEVLIGQTLQQIQRALDASSSYQINTPGMALTARGTEFAVRVEDSGRSGMLVTEGDVAAAADDQTADVGVGFGVRADETTGLSDVVAATTFDQLDSALDGCTISVTTPDDVSINLRTGPAINSPLVGYISAAEISTAKGTTAANDWYRIEYAGGHAWFLSSTAEVVGECAGLRVFEATHREDVSLYDDSVTVSDVPVSTPEPEATDESESADETDAS